MWQDVDRFEEKAEGDSLSFPSQPDASNRKANRGERAWELTGGL
jgi:hypothetical protein